MTCAITIERKLSSAINLAGEMIPARKTIIHSFNLTSKDAAGLVMICGGSGESHGFKKEELERVHAPIGTNIGAETPEELAVSIVGELIKARSDKDAHKKKDKSSASAPCCRIQAV